MYYRQASQSQQVGDSVGCTPAGCGGALPWQTRKGNEPPKSGGFQLNGSRRESRYWLHGGDARFSIQILRRIAVSLCNKQRLGYKNHTLKLSEFASDRVIL